MVLARHFPTIGQATQVALFQNPSGLRMGLAAPDEVEWEAEWPLGPLRYSTRLTWPSEP